ncbi:hypothetical protein SAMN03159304_01690 [Pseudomonas sp. NFACC24-1]|nr:hypothetical protein SAMN03159304_01690 [Pseudomonas sp. NFACC24-1]
MPEASQILLRGCCAFRVPGRQARPLMGSGRETIEAMGKAHKRADSGVVVGNGARMRSLVEALGWENKQAFVVPRIRGDGACSRSVAQRFFCRDAPVVLGLLRSPAGINPLATG